MKNRSFNISISTQNYADKNCIEWKNVVYREQSITTNQFVELVRSGYCFCQCFNVSGDFGVKLKNDANFKSARMMFIDVDDSIIPLDNAITLLSHQPTVSYTTPNNYTQKSNFKYRFRLCYLFDEVINTIELYRNVYDAIITSIKNDIESFEINDNCGRRPSQQFGGNGNGNCEIFNSSITYKFSDFQIDGKGNQKNEERKEILKENVNSEFINDIYKLKDYEFISKYREIYTFFERTPLEYEDGYAILPQNFTMIKRKGYCDNFIKDDGTVKRFSRCKKMRDGEGRKKKMYSSALIRKQIFPSITFEHLLFNLVCDRFFYYDNSDGELNNKRLIDIAKRVINTPIEQITIPLYRPKEFEVDKEYCILHGITPNQMKNIVKKRITDGKIGECYDCSLSIKENLVLLNEMGIKVGKSRMYEWCKENGIETNPNQSNNTSDKILCCFVREVKPIYRVA